jgi:hypothetical protein
MKDFKWVIRSNQKKDYPVTIQDIDVAAKIWCKNISALKGKTTLMSFICASVINHDITKVMGQ